MSGVDYDVIVVGGGSGGLAAAFRAAAHGASVAMLEPAAIGGTCVNVGCVPKKVMWHAAELAGQIAKAHHLGFDVAQTPELSWPTLLERRGRYIANIHASYERRLVEQGITRIAQAGRLVAADTVECADGTRLRARHIVLATGARPVRPELPGAALGKVSDDFFALRQRPQNVVIVGGGYIAVELAGLLCALGTAVTLLVRGKRLLDGFDAEISAHLAHNLQQQGVHIQFGGEVESLEEAGAAGVRVRDKSGGDACFEHVFFAIGRTPNTADLGLEGLGISLGKKGQVVVDDQQATSVPGVYAVGDLTNRVALTPVAVAAARRLMDRLLDGQTDAKLDYDNIPSVVFTHPPIGVVGLSEAQAREKHRDVTVYYSRFRPMLSSLADYPPRSLFKLVCAGPEERVVGIHLIGVGVDEILQGFAVALKLGVTRAQLLEMVPIHPTSAEEVLLAG